MTEDERAFWSAIVQIIPVLALALVIEARTAESAFVVVFRTTLSRVVFSAAVFAIIISVCVVETISLVSLLGYSPGLHPAVAVLVTTVLLAIVLYAPGQRIAQALRGHSSSRDTNPHD